MDTYWHSPVCVGGILDILLQLQELPGLEDLPCGDSLQRRLGVVVRDCQALQREEVRSNRKNWEAFERSILNFTRLFVPVLLNQRGLETTFEGGFGELRQLYDADLRYFGPLLGDLERFAAVGGWFEGWFCEEHFSDTLQARLEAAIMAGKRLKGKLEQGTGERAQLQLRALFEGMLRQAFMLLISVPFSPKYKGATFEHLRAKVEAAAI